MIDIPWPLDPAVDPSRQPNLLGRPDGIERLGGIDFDEAVFSHVAGAAAVALATLDPDDMAVRTAVVSSG